MWADLKPHNIELSAEDIAWIDAIVNRVTLTLGWERDRAEAEARSAVIEFYERGGGRRIEEELQQERLAYVVETQRLQREAVQHTEAENRLRQRNARELEERQEQLKRQEILRRARLASDQREKAQRRAKEHAERVELYRKQRNAWRSANGVVDAPVDYTSWSFYDAMLEHAREYGDDLIKGEMVDIVHSWRADIDATCSEVEWSAKYETEPEKFDWFELLLDY